LHWTFIAEILEIARENFSTASARARTLDIPIASA
jgi:hypothetical protein